jgi:hypothetical protein
VIEDLKRLIHHERSNVGDILAALLVVNGSLGNRSSLIAGRYIDHHVPKSVSGA